VVEEIYRLFDRRRTATALARLSRRREGARRFKRLGEIFQELQSPDPKKAPTFLDDRLLESTSEFVRTAKAMLSPRLKPAQGGAECERLLRQCAISWLATFI
jgi:hypothetical protein